MFDHHQHRHVSMERSSDNNDIPYPPSEEDAGGPAAEDNHHDHNPRGLSEYEKLLALQEEIESSRILNVSGGPTSVPRTSSKDSVVKKTGSGKLSPGNNNNSNNNNALMMPGAFQVKNGSDESLLVGNNSSGKKIAAASAVSLAASAASTSTAGAVASSRPVGRQTQQPESSSAAAARCTTNAAANSRGRTQRSVHFDTRPPRIDHDNGGWWFEEYASSYWYTRHDLETFKNDRKNTVKALKRCNFDLYVVERQGYILRGFECYFSMEINKAFKYTRCLVVSLVRTEQDRQRQECFGVSQPELIRESSMCASEWARDNAVQLGVKDLEEVWPVDYDGRQAHLYYIEDQVRDQQAYYMAKTNGGMSPRKRKTDQPERPCIKNGRSGCTSSAGPTTSTATTTDGPSCYDQLNISAESLVQPFADTRIG